MLVECEGNPGYMERSYQKMEVEEEKKNKKEEEEEGMRKKKVLFN